jgi:hypothetical protein
MCRLCNKIYNKQEKNEWLNKQYKDKDHYHIIAYVDGAFILYSSVEDEYYTPQTALYDIEYCPWCGKHLLKN